MKCLFRDCRALVVEMILATDMNHHFDLLKRLESSLEWPES